jgi:four helix bundle protein
MATIKRFEDLEVWKESRKLNAMIANIIREKRFGSDFKFIHQVLGSSGSVMDNIAEGFERGTKAEFIQFLGYSRGSCSELRSQFYRAFDFHYIRKDELDMLLSLTSQINAMIYGLMNYLKRTNINGHRKKQP